MTRADLDAFQAGAERFFAWAESEGYERQAGVAAQLKVCVAELRAARGAREDLARLRDDLDANDVVGLHGDADMAAAVAHRLGAILRFWDGGS